MGKEFGTQKAALDKLMASYRAKQTELDQLRAKASDDSRALAVELAKAQNETNMLIMELKKYEGLVAFMGLEKELIMRAIEDAKGVDPGLAARGLDAAEQRMEALEERIDQLKDEWLAQLEEVRQEAERVLSEDEVREFKTRIQILSSELESKNAEIEQVAAEKQRVEETVKRIFEREDVDIKEQSEEIEHLNLRYRRALTDKIKVYDQLVQSVRTLADRNSQFMRNEVELCRLANLASITKLELD